MLETSSRSGAPTSHESMLCMALESPNRGTLLLIKSLKKQQLFIRIIWPLHLLYPDNVLSQCNVIRRKKIPAINHRVPWSPLDKEWETPSQGKQFQNHRNKISLGMKPEIICIVIVLQKALSSSKALPAPTSQDRLKWLRELKWLLSLSLRSRQPGMRTNAHKSIKICTISNDPKVRDTALDFCLSPAP